MPSQNDSMENGEFYTFLYNSFSQMAAHLEKGGAAYVFHADTEGLNFRKAFVDAGFHLAGVCIYAIIVEPLPPKVSSTMAFSWEELQMG